MNARTSAGKTKDQGWEIGVRRTLSVNPTRAWHLLLNALGIFQEDNPDMPVYQKGMTLESADHTRIEIRSYEPGRLMRMRWQPPDQATESTLQIRVLPAKTGTTVSIHHERLEDADQREAMRMRWTALLENLDR